MLLVQTTENIPSDSLILLMQYFTFPAPFEKIYLSWEDTQTRYTRIENPAGPLIRQTCAIHLVSCAFDSEL